MKTTALTKVQLLSAAQMRAAEAAAMDSGVVTGLELMERAGRGVVGSFLERWSGTPGRAVVLAGPGNNGGDGYVIARGLSEAGWHVEVFALGTASRLPPDALANHDRWAAEHPVHSIADVRDALQTPPEVLVDALFGTGLDRALSGEAAERWSEVGRMLRPSRSSVFVVAVDLPSGLNADTGEDLGVSLGADLTVTFHTAKLGHHLGQGPALCGALEVVDIGLTEDLGDSGAVARLAGPDAILLTGKAGTEHKYDHGHVLMLGGGSGRGGAARLAARAALRIGAGLVTVGVPREALVENAARLDAVMLRTVETAVELSDALEDRRINALCLGPGLGVGLRTRDLVLAALSSRRATVLDADALTVFAEAPSELFDALHSRVVLTPHAGEFARLFDTQSADKLETTRAAARLSGATVLFKGPDTVIAAPDGEAIVHSAAYGRETPWLATAGAGDVLAGLIAGLMARGISPLRAAESAAWLHVEAARTFGPGLIAEDIPEAIPAVLGRLQSGAIS